MTNAHAARAWLVAALGDDAVSRHFVAVSTNAEKVGRVRHRHRQHVRLLGLGRRPLLDGLRHRPEHDDRRGQRGLPRPARRLPRDGRALRDGAAGAATCRCSWACSPSGTATSSGSRPPPCCPTRSTCPASPPTCSSSPWRATARACASTARRSTYETGAIYWGEPGHERAALVLPAAAPGHEHGRVRRHRRRADREPARRPAGHARRERARAGVGAGAADARPPRWRPTARRRTSCAHKVMPGNRPVSRAHGGAPRPLHPRRARRPVRAQRVRPGRDLGDRLLRPVGRRARQEGGDGHPRRPDGSAPAPFDPSTDASIALYRRCATGAPAPSGRRRRGAAGTARTRGRWPRRWPRAGRRRRGPPRAA